MILKALCDYYDRCDTLMQKGLELKEIGYLIVVENDGTFVRLESRMKDKKIADSFCVIQAVKRSGKMYLPNYFWDKYEYVVGGEGDSKKKHKTFIDMLNAFKLRLPKNQYVNAVFNFYQKYENVESVIGKDVLYEELRKSSKYISFLLNGSTCIAAEDSEIINGVLSNNDKESIDNVCLITGVNSSIARLHTSIKLTKDTGPLVSFQKGCGYNSYGKLQAYNAPVSERAEFAYTTALNHLLRYDSRNKFTIGSRTYLFWASSNNEACSQAEDCIFNMFGFNQNEDDPNKQIEQVHKIFKAIYSGTLETSLDDKFYILGLAPNAARIAVVYWAEIQLKKFAGLISRHFDDMEIVDGRFERFPYMGLKSILGAVTLGGKSNEATPNLPDAVVKSIFQGLPYPYTLFAGCIRRIRAEQSIKITRAAILKAYLNRLDNKEQKIKVMLDKENKNQGYLCGRLFAALEKIQEEANNQHSIRERYLNSASATPAIVFPTILNLSSHHSEKLSEGRNVWFEKLKQEIVDKISADGFPVHLDLQDQGRFFVGYYHQRQEFFEKKSDKNENE